MNEPKLCKCSCTDLDHETSQLYGIYHCLNCKISCSSDDFRKLPKGMLFDYKNKLKEFDIKGILANSQKSTPTQPKKVRK